MVMLWWLTSERIRGGLGCRPSCGGFDEENAYLDSCNGRERFEFTVCMLSMGKSSVRQRVIRVDM
jgi:hypothetical protein